jgi:hypothetical protein
VSLNFLQKVKFNQRLITTIRQLQESTEHGQVQIVVEMDPSTLSEPGFGWATRKMRLVTLDENGRFVTESDVNEGFPSSFPFNFVRAFCAKNAIDFRVTNEEFSTTVREVLTTYLSSNHKLEEYDEFFKTGKSNGRTMKWDIMTISPNTSFKLHAHPNIEIIYVIQGAIHEYRYEVQFFRSKRFSKGLIL